MQVKVCSKCRVEKSVSDFSTAKGTTAKDGLHSRCKECRKEDERGRRLAKGTPRLVDYFALQAQLLEQDRRLCRMCNEIKPLTEFSKVYCISCGRNLSRLWRQENIEYARKKSRIHYHMNPGYYLQWRSSNGDRIRENHRDWYERNKEKKLAQNAKWIKEHPAYSNRRASIRRKAMIAENIDLAWLRQRDTLCYLCRSIINYDLSWPDPLSKSIDHLIPLSKGGSHTLKNVAYTHLRCNIKKGTKIGKLC